MRQASKLYWEVGIERFAVVGLLGEVDLKEERL